ncbi:MAG TPA: chromate transporter [Acidiphilium sp.]|nr:chromate transporter [Acidiphilium sp.]
MTAESPRPGLAALFSGFFVAGLSGFGGVLPFARRIMVERRGWLTAAEFSDLFSLCQFLPGPNVVNLAAAFGARQRGFAGATVAIVGLLAAPVAIVIALGAVYERIGSIPPVHHALQGLAAGAAGLFAAAALRIAWPAARLPARAAVVGLAFALFGVLHLPLPAVIAIATPLSVLVAWRQHR